MGWLGEVLLGEVANLCFELSLFICFVDPGDEDGPIEEGGFGGVLLFWGLCEVGGFDVWAADACDDGVREALREGYGIGELVEHGEGYAGQEGCFIGEAGVCDGVVFGGVVEEGVEDGVSPVGGGVLFAAELAAPVLEDFSWALWGIEGIRGVETEEHFAEVEVGALREGKASLWGFFGESVAEVCDGNGKGFAYFGVEEVSKGESLNGDMGS